MKRRKFKGTPIPIQFFCDKNEHEQFVQALEKYNQNAVVRASMTDILRKLMKDFAQAQL